MHVGDCGRVEVALRSVAMRASARCHSRLNYLTNEHTNTSKCVHSNTGTTRVDTWRAVLVTVWLWESDCVTGWLHASPPLCAGVAEREAPWS